MTALIQSICDQPFVLAGGWRGDEFSGYDRPGPACVYVQGWSLKRICREPHVSRNTVRKILRSGETSFSYERERQPQPKTRRAALWRDAKIGDAIPLSLGPFFSGVSGAIELRLSHGGIYNTERGR